MVEHNKDHMEEMDLDSVDYSDTDSKDFDDIDLEGFGEVDSSIDKPHIKVSYEDFVRFIKSAKEVTSVSGRDVITRSICLKVEGDQLVCRVTDFDVYLEQRIENLNVENVLEDAIVIPMDIIQKLLKASPSIILIYKETDGEYKMRLSPGDILLEVFAVSPDKFIFSDEVKYKGSLVAEDIHSVVKDFGGLVNSAVSPKEKRILLGTDAAYANYAIAVVRYLAKFHEMDLKVKDINILKFLLKGLEGNVKVYRTTDSKVERAVFEGDNFKYAFLVSDITIPNRFKEDIDRIVAEDGVYVDFNNFYRLIEISAELSYSVGRVELDFTEDKELKVVLKTKKGKDGEFFFPGSVTGNPKGLQKTLVIQAKLLRLLLKSFANKGNIRVSLNEDGMGLYVDNYEAVLYREDK